MGQRPELIKTEAARYYPAMAPVALGGALLGATGGAASGLARMKSDPYADPKKDALWGALGGGALASTMYGFSKLNPWLFLPAGVAGTAALYMRYRDRDERRRLLENGPPRYDFSQA
jgi:hypothetical protein